MKLKHFLLVSLIVLFLTGCMKESKDLTYTGTIEADEIDISSEVSGTLQKLFIEEGKEIKKGEKIAKIDTTSLNLKLKEAKARLNSANAQLKDISNGTRIEEVKKAKASLESIEALLEGAKSKYDYLSKNYDDLKNLYENDAVSEKKLEEAKTLVDQSLSNFKNLQKQYDQGKVNLDFLLKGPTGEKIKIAQSEVERVNASIELLQYQISKGEIYSPIDGVVQNINYNENEFIQNGANIANILDLNNKWIKIYIPEKELHRISLNQELNINVDYLENEKIKGKVVYISPKAEFTPKNVESKENKEEMVFEVKIKIIKDSDLLKPGMFADVKLEGDK
ncbi:HlyD family secretion protein [Tepidibacter formicigenes]|uniref:HlyD family secretion protein n=1 Tax=Tepidibacter formicigenes DSM 15518 TaxID=1123349 RepID=A0A1M6R8J5_9FIRM|nr:efflux RND transporter periplasmic adaptor subunit [Tepidibacter formicigenes]SHK28783.1 HlyD family secretion protein [Tepidibacter formicigenes DSM 15518]